MGDETLGFLNETLGMIRATSDWGGAHAGKQAISHKVTHEFIHDSSDCTNQPSTLSPSFEGWEKMGRLFASLCPISYNMFAPHVSRSARRTTPSVPVIDGRRCTNKSIAHGRKYHYIVESTYYMCDGVVRSKEQIYHHVGWR